MIVFTSLDLVDTFVQDHWSTHAFYKDCAFHESMLITGHHLIVKYAMTMSVDSFQAVLCTRN